jgi:hypothetical protein
LFWGRLESSIAGNIGGMYKAMMKIKYDREDMSFCANELKDYKTVVDFLIENVPLQGCKVFLYGVFDDHEWVLPPTIFALHNLGIKISGICITNTNKK